MSVGIDRGRRNIDAPYPTAPPLRARFCANGRVRRTMLVTSLLVASDVLRCGIVRWSIFGLITANRRSGISGLRRKAKGEGRWERKKYGTRCAYVDTDFFIAPKNCPYVNSEATLPLSSLSASVFNALLISMQFIWCFFPIVKQSG